MTMACDDDVVYDPNSDLTPQLGRFVLLPESREALDKLRLLGYDEFVTDVEKTLTKCCTLVHTETLLRRDQLHLHRRERERLEATILNQRRTINMLGTIAWMALLALVGLLSYLCAPYVP